MRAIALRIISMILVVAFTATSVPSFGGSPLGRQGQSLLAPQSRFKAAQAAQFKQAGVRRVLIIESDDNAREVLKGFAKIWRHGVKIEAVRNESEALDKIEAGSSFDVVFANYDNEGIDATSLAMSINRGRAIEEMTPIILITGKDLEDLRSPIMEGIFTPLMKQGSLFDVIEKPFSQRHINDSLDAADQFLNTRSNIEAAEAVVNTLPLDAINWADFEDIMSLISLRGSGGNRPLTKGGNRLRKELAGRGVHPLDRAQFHPIASAFIKIKAEKYIKEMADRRLIDRKRKDALEMLLKYLLHRYNSPGVMEYDAVEYYNILGKIGNHSPATFNVARGVLKTANPGLNDDVIDQIAWRMRNIGWFLRKILGREFGFGIMSASDQRTIVNEMDTVLKYATGNFSLDANLAPPAGSPKSAFEKVADIMALPETTGTLTGMPGREAASSLLAPGSAFDKRKGDLTVGADNEPLVRPDVNAGKAAPAKARPPQAGRPEPSEAGISGGIDAIKEFIPELGRQFTTEVISVIGKGNFMRYASMVARHLQRRPKDWRDDALSMAEMIVLRAVGNQLVFADESRAKDLLNLDTIERDIAEQEVLFEPVVGKQTPEAQERRQKLAELRKMISDLEEKILKDMRSVEAGKETPYHEEAQSLARGLTEKSLASDEKDAYYKALSQLRERDKKELEGLRQEVSIIPKRSSGFTIRKHLIAVTLAGLLILAAGVRAVHDIRKEIGRRAYITRTRVVLGLDKPAKGKEITIPMLIEDLKKKSGYDWIPATLALIQEGPEAVPYLLAALEKEEDKAFRSHIIYILRNIAAEKPVSSVSRSGGFASYNKLLFLLIAAAVIAPWANFCYLALGMAAVPVLLGDLDAAIRSDKSDDIVNAIWHLMVKAKRKETASQAMVAVPILVNLIRSKKATPGVRRYAIFALGEMCERNVVNDPAMVPALTEVLLTDEAAEVREAAAEALGRIEMGETDKDLAVGALIVASSYKNEKYWKVRSKAVVALKKKGQNSEPAREALNKAFREDERLTVRQRAGMALASFEAGRVVASSP